MESIFLCFCLFVGFSAFLLFVFFPVKDQGRCSAFKKKKKRKNNLFTRITAKHTHTDRLNYHVSTFYGAIRRINDHIVHFGGFEMPNKWECQNSSASSYEYSPYIINHCHLSECKFCTSCIFYFFFVPRCTVGGIGSAITTDRQLCLTFSMLLFNCIDLTLK